jgi:hypothetical protein
MTLFHGTRSATFSASIGLCLTPDQDAAARYARRSGTVYEVSISLDGLNVLDVEVAQSDIDNNNWPGDSDESVAALVAQGADVVRYTDMDEQGYTHTTLRLLTPVAVAAVSGATALDSDEE